MLPIISASQTKTEGWALWMLTAEVFVGCRRQRHLDFAICGKQPHRLPWLRCEKHLRREPDVWHQAGPAGLDTRLSPAGHLGDDGCVSRS